MDEQFSTCAISEDGKFMVVGSGNDFLYLFEDDMRVPLWSYKMEDDVMSVDISANGDYIVACDVVGDVLLFSRHYGIPIWEYKGQSYSKVKISADGGYVAFLTANSLYIYDKEMDSLLWSCNFNEMAYFLDISNDGNEIAVCVGEILYFFEIGSNSPVWQYDTGDIMMDLVISSSGNLIAIGGQNQKVNLFSQSSSIPIKTYQTGINIHSIAISKDESYVAITCSGLCYLFNTDEDIYLWGYPLAPDSSSVALSSDGSFIISGDINFDKGVFILHCLNKAQNIPLWSIRVQGVINQVAISDDGNSIGVVTQKYFYHIDRSNPKIFEWTLILINLSYIGLALSVGLAFFSGLLYAYNKYIHKKKDEMEIEKFHQTILKHCPNCMTSSKQEGLEYCEYCGSELI